MVEEALVDVSEDMKKAGFCYRKPDKSSEKFKLAEKLCEKEWIRK